MHPNEWFILPVIGVTANRLCFLGRSGAALMMRHYMQGPGSPICKATLRKAGGTRKGNKKRRIANALACSALVTNHWCSKP